MELSPPKTVGNKLPWASSQMQTIGIPVFAWGTAALILDYAVTGTAFPADENSFMCSTRSASAVDVFMNLFYAVQVMHLLLMIKYLVLGEVQVLNLPLMILFLIFVQYKSCICC